MNSATPNRILYLNTAFLGDAILSTPVLRALKNLYPQARLDLVAIPQTASVFSGNPYISQVYTWDKRDPWKRILGLVKLLIRLRKNRYDLALSPHVHFSTTLIMILAGIPVRIGFPRLKGSTHVVRVAKGMPVVRRNLELLRPLSGKPFDHQTEMFIPAEGQNQVDEFIKENSLDPARLVGIAPGSVWATKRWPSRYYSQVLSGLVAKGFQPVLIGGEDDAGLCGKIITDSQVEAVNAAGQLSLPGSAWLIKNCRLLITNDSAPLHLANAVQTPVLAIFGPTVKRFGFFPYREGDRVLEMDLDCRPCGKHGHQRCPRGHFGCMTRISPESVLNNALEMLNP
ncbi:MAG: glycosyltransferase family 9 protein [Candidatus Syntrophosphaera sp.]|nr:glycosyltransferase family 9 protein [Candidatus Syntrophosphaera sp.]